ncbi:MULTISPECIES: TetR/AcrR family transcriptional regulator [Silvimonas]|uniref:TetR/AcrR family transcriptional regulator n=1 Tax=Silvimonas TaxID=300264 RepID=UPI0024B3670F|nr:MULTISPECIES: TetR/AcrR family transcriptional regulator [Silvimonas]MDR3426519.1 TetR/AcrR family transcriptional regulator [Silvimonas sp.]
MAERGRPRCFDREQALTKAMDVFWRNGYEGSSLAHLTEAMGINSPSLYATFGSKEALFKEAVDQYDLQEGAEIQAALESSPHVRTAISNMLQTSATCFSDPDKPAGCMVLLAATNCTPENASVWQYMSERRKHSLDILQQRLARAVAEGDIPACADVEKMAAFYGSVRNGMSIQARDGASRALLQAIAEAAMGAWDGLIATPANADA